ncbi:hypothetical protein PGTUg99_023877 [Puccinia graminis f. sp. tritici]|uniref:Nuclear pore complex protein Nup160 n=1 Tax=Puccinia graminis f. sp. tritici TaxID=56615 RepID=A0A5B0RZC1_PUCGR|nr:hypothetical protein PGTUg99_023877 [Puccinia graminis f. sp. tritici]
MNHQLTTTTTQLDSLRPRFESAIEYQIPTNNNHNSSSRTNNQTHTIQANHASQSNCFFPPTPTDGWIKTTVINNGFTLELRWINPTKTNNQNNPLQPLDNSPSHQPIHFHFHHKIIPSPFITISTNESSELALDQEEEGEDQDQEQQEKVLIILILTDNYTLYRLKFSYPQLFYSELFEEDWLTDYEVEEIINRQVILTHGIDSNNLIISSSDGILTHLSWGKLIGINENYGWKTSNLSYNRSSALWNFLPTSWSSSAVASSKTISSSAHEWIATPTSTISIASHLTAGSNGEDAWLFTISRDRKLKAWSLTTGLCLKELPLDHHSLASLSSTTKTISTTTTNDHQQDLLLPAAPRPLARFIYSDEGDDPSYEGFLILFVPSPVSPSFVTYGLSLTAENQFKDLVLLEERRCDWNGKNGLQMGELRDFQISKVDLSIGFTTSPSKQRPWGLWAVWDDEIGGEGILQYTILHETRNWQESVRTSWVTIQPPDRRTPWNSSFFDELLANDPSSSVTEVFIDHLFRPGHFSSSDLEYALETYETSLESDDDQPAVEMDNSVYESLEEKICAVVGSKVKLEISKQTGAPMIEGYHRKLRIEWLKFATMCAESRASSLWPIELAVDADRQQLFIIGRRSITTPVLIDTASLLSQLVGAVDSGQRPPLLDQQVSGIDQYHPLLSNLNNRRDLVGLVGAINCLAAGLSHGEVIKPLEDELMQIVRRPIKFSIVDLLDDLFRRRLQPSIDDGLQAQIAERLGQVNGLELAFQLLWTILSTSELVRCGPDEGGEGVKVTILSQMFLSDYLVNALEKRFELTRNALIFLVYLCGEEETTGAKLGEFAGLTSQYLLSFQQSIMARWLVRQSAKIPAELAFEVEDKLVDRLVELHVSTEAELGAHPGGAMIRDANSATSLLSSLLLTKFIPELNGRLKLPGSLAEAGSTFLELVGLYTNLSQLSESELTAIKLIHTHPNIILLIHFFLNVHRPSVALDLLHLLPDTGCAVQFLFGLAYLLSGSIEEAETGFIKAASAIYDDNFEVDDQSGLSLILPEPSRKSLTEYYNYIVLLFEPIGADQSIAKFCQLAIDSSSSSTFFTSNTEDDYQNEKNHLNQLVLNLWVKLFKALVNLALWDDAYQALVSIPSIESQNDCLRTLVSHMCEANEVDKLLRFSWTGLQIEFEKTISFRARNSDPLGLPNYFSILYAYHINRADYRSAAISMYQHARKIGDISIKGGAFQFMLTQQCQSYLAAINALSLVPEKQAWIPMSCPKVASQDTYGSEARRGPGTEGMRSRKRVTYYVPEEEFLGGTRDVEVLKLADLRAEYTLVLSRLQLANELPQLSQPGTSTTSGAYLDGATLVPMVLNQGRLTEALEKAIVLGTDLGPLFVRLAESCCRLSLDIGLPGNSFDFQWVNGDPLAAHWDTDLVSKAWALLQRHLTLIFPISSSSPNSLDHHQNHQFNPSQAWKTREAVLETILKSARNLKVPLWLLKLFLDFNPTKLLKIFFKFDLLSDAFTVALHIIDQVAKTQRSTDPLMSKKKNKKLMMAGHPAIPFTDIDQLLTLTAEDLTVSTSTSLGEEGGGSHLAGHLALEGEEGVQQQGAELDPLRLSHLQNLVYSKLNQIFDPPEGSFQTSDSASSAVAATSTSSSGLNRQLVGR